MGDARSAKCGALEGTAGTHSAIVRAGRFEIAEDGDQEIRAEEKIGSHVVEESVFKFEKRSFEEEEKSLTKHHPQFDSAGAVV